MGVLMPEQRHVVRRPVTVDVHFTPAMLAEAFCEMNDEGQAQFFIEVARVAATWPPGGTFPQWYAVGRHLRTCACSNDDTREIVRELAQGVDDDRSGRQLRFAEQVITAARKAGMTDAALTEALARYDRAQIDTFFVAHNVPQSDLAHEVAP